jgi:hypothetical protein
MLKNSTPELAKYGVIEKRQKNVPFDHPLVYH